MISPDSSRSRKIRLNEVNINERSIRGKKISPEIQLAFAGFLYGLIFFLLQVQGVSALIDALRNSTIKNYVLAPSQSVRFYARQSADGSTASPDEGDADGVEEVPDEGDVDGVEEVPEEVVPPEVVLDKFQVACMTFTPSDKANIKRAFSVGAIQALLSIIYNLRSIANGDSIVKILPLLLMDIILVASFSNVFSTLNRTTADVYSGKTEEICLRVENTLILPLLRFSTGYWLFYTLVKMPMISWEMYKY